MFTVNPVSGDKGELVIDAGLGLGEAVVSGLVTPDHFIVSKSRLRIKEFRVGRREVIIRSNAEGGTEQVPYQQLKLKKACISTCKPFSFVPLIHFFGRDQTISRP
jgi:rifampicin phosphotransferase